MNSSSGRGLIRTISMVDSKTVVDVAVLPGLQCLCVVHADSSVAYLYTFDGVAVGSFDVRLQPLTGIAALQTETNAVVCSGPRHKALCVTSLSKSSQNIEVVEQKLWTLHFSPFHVSSFKRDLLLVLDGNSSVVFIFTEKGHQLRFIRILQDPRCGEQIPYRCIGTSRGLWCVMNSRDQRKQSSAIFVNPKGKVVSCYRGGEGGRRPLLGSFGICKVGSDDIAISDGVSNRIHLVNKDGEFRKFLLMDSDVVRPTCLLVDESTEESTLLVACEEKDAECGQIRVYDCNTVMAAQPLAKSSKVLDVGQAGNREQTAPGQVSQSDGRETSHHKTQDKAARNNFDLRQETLTALRKELTTVEMPRQNRSDSRAVKPEPPISTKQSFMEIFGGISNAQPKNVVATQDVRDIEVVSCKGLIRKIELTNQWQPVSGVAFLPTLQCLCVVQSNSNQLSLYSANGGALGSIDLCTTAPTAVVALKTKRNALIVSASVEQSLIVITLAKTAAKEQVFQTADECLWKLRFPPMDICSFKEDKLLVLDSTRSGVCVLTEDGQNLGYINIEHGFPAGTVPVRCLGMPGGVWVVMKDPRNSKSSMLRVNHTGKVTARYQHTLHEAWGLCELHDRCMAITDMDGQVHLIDRNGIFQRILVKPVSYPEMTMEICFDSSAEQPKLFVAAVDNSTGLHVRIYDHQTLLS